jgi:hypothetical protein
MEKPDWVPTVVVRDGAGNVGEMWINDSKHFDDFEPCRIICRQCKREIPAVRGEMIVMCGCGAINRGYGTMGRGEPIVDASS